MVDMKLNVKKFALAGGIYVGACAAALTAGALLNVPGLPQFAAMLASFYGPWGYSVSLPGVFIGAFWGFTEGFVHLGLFAWLYNKLTR